MERHRRESEPGRGRIGGLKQHTQTREELGSLLAQGNEIVLQIWLNAVAARVLSENHPDNVSAARKALRDRIQRWITIVSEHLETNFGKAEVAIFLSDAGIPQADGVEPYEPDISISPLETADYRGVSRRLYRIQQLMDRCQ